MKQHSSEEIFRKVSSVWPDLETSWGGPPIVVSENRPDSVRVEICKMYEAPPYSLDDLNEMAEFFGTKNLDVHNDINEGGCESCDYGSRYGFIIHAWA